MAINNYDSILEEMKKALAAFDRQSDKFSAYDYESKFRELTDKYNMLLFQASVGKVPASKNKKIAVSTSFGKVSVKKTPDEYVTYGI